MSEMLEQEKVIASAPQNEASEQVEITQITIDEDFKKLFSLLSPEKYEGLKQSIATEGIHDPLWVWEHQGKLLLLDGHNRIRICGELRIETVAIRKKFFRDKQEALLWMWAMQANRRNMNLFQRVEAALQLKPYFSEKARANQRAAGGGLSENVPEAVDTSKELAKLAVTSDRTVRNVEKILAQANKRDIEALRRGDPKISIHSVLEKCQNSSPKKSADQSEITDNNLPPSQPNGTVLRAKLDKNGQCYEAKRHKALGFLNEVLAMGSLKERKEFLRRIGSWLKSEHVTLHADFAKAHAKETAQVLPNTEPETQVQQDTEPPS